MTGALVPTTKDIPAFDEIVEAFVARDYVAASRGADALIHQPGPVQGLQLSLISLCRTGEAPKALWYGQLAMDRLRAEDSWSADLVGLATGKIAMGSLSNEGLSDVANCQVRFYAAASKISAGRLDEAEALLAACLEIGAPCLELYLAQVEMDAITANRDPG